MKYDDAIIKNPKSKYHSLYWSNITNTFVTRHQIVKQYGSMQNWVDTVIFEIQDINDRPKCCICGKPAKFTTILYHSTCGAANCLRARNKQQQLDNWKRWDSEKRDMRGLLAHSRRWQVQHLTDDERKQQYWHNSGEHRSEATRNKCHDKMILKWQDAEFRARLIHKHSRGKFCILSTKTDLQYCINDSEYVRLDSTYEQLFVKLLESLHINYIVEPCTVKYISSLAKHAKRPKRLYIVDFAILFRNYTIYVEIKPWFSRNDTDVIEKFNAFQESIQDKPNTLYTMMYEGEIQQGEQHLLEVLNQLINGAWQPAKPGEIPG